MRFFEDLHAEISANGFLHHEDWKGNLCGNQDLFDSLMQLKTEVHMNDILLFSAISAKCRIFDMSIPPDFQQGSEKARVIAESRAKCGDGCTARRRTKAASRRSRADECHTG
jgi:hypothetical protein